MAQNNITAKTMMNDSKKWLSVIGLGGCGSNLIDEIQFRSSERIGLYKFDAEYDQSFDFIKCLFGQLTILTVGLGGQYGTNKLLEIVNNISTNNGSVFVVAIIPYTFEGEERRKKALETLQAIKGKDITLVTFDNDLIRSMIIDSSLTDMNGPINSVILGMINLLLRPDMISLDINDIKTFSQDAKEVAMAFIPSETGINQVTIERYIELCPVKGHPKKLLVVLFARLGIEYYSLFEPFQEYIKSLPSVMDVVWGYKITDDMVPEGIFILQK